ncbi:hypothetical protein ACLOJK_019294 [Asimina triloba]
MQRVALDRADAARTSFTHVGGTLRLREADPLHRRMLFAGRVLIPWDRWLRDLFGVSPHMGADEHWKIIGARKSPEETSVAQVSKVVLHLDPLLFVWEYLATTLLVALSEPRSIAEEELEVSLVRRCLATTLSAALSEARHHCSIFFYELQEIEQRASHAAALEAKAVDVAKALRQDLYAS